MLWESTCGPSSTAKLVSNVVLSDKVYAIDCQPVPSTGAYRIVVGMANRNIDVFEVDLNSPKLDCIQKRESSLKYQTRCVRICPIDPNSSRSRSYFSFRMLINRGASECGLH